MSDEYRVRATALNLRIAADTGSAALTVLPRGARVRRLDAALTGDGWLRVAADGFQGFVKASFLEPIGSTNGAAPPIGSAVPASTVDVDAKNRNLALLHPAFRERITRVVDRLAHEQIPFRIFEAYRAPERQARLYRQGRDLPGSIVTRARAWSSFHQYGVASDLVLFDPSWTWDDSGVRGGWWKRMQEIGREEGLRALSFEMPHLELPLEIDDLRRGIYPAGGDDSWENNLAAAIRRWTGSPAAPPLMDERPPLPPSS